ncbi:hypothetical protein [Mucilaginibacter paludis]|uniref:Uncharacterized protein n=1 Tax=Mucilaginibacter paludis DSM 18603 TaxID=714943 RepID=H1Y7S9_9SPHI|nr:hypothetical protein [Mucilaginibacter paludis]EHQ29924.1 hypothetical protein Mucpa_5858 [Mucilaginibacter paludis DSM 18603]
MKHYIVTESDFDLRLLSMLIPAELIVTTKIINSGGYSSALSVGKTLILKPENLDSNIILFLSADTNDESKISEKLNFIKSYIGYDDRLEIILVKPQVASILFESPDLIGRLAKMKGVEYDIALGRYIPDDVLKSFKITEEEILNTISQDDILKLSAHGDVKNLIEILKHHPVIN